MIVAIVGRGAVGTALAKALSAAGVEVERLPGRGPGAPRLARASLVVLAVPDARIAEVALRIAPSLGRSAAVVHCAGARPADELGALRPLGHPVGAMHPLVSFADRKKPPTMGGATFVIGGDRGAVAKARALARRIGGRPLLAEVHGPTYHAAAALVANGTVGLAHAGVGLLVSLGCARRDAERAMAGLLRTVAENVATVGVPAALTGPIARGDAETVGRHRATLVGTKALSVYDGIAPAVLACAREAGLARDAARGVERALALTPPRPSRARRRSGAARPRPRS